MSAASRPQFDYDWITSGLQSTHVHPVKPGQLRPAGIWLGLCTRSLRSQRGGQITSSVYINPRFELGRPGLSTKPPKQSQNLPVCERGTSRYTQDVCNHFKAALKTQIRLSITPAVSHLGLVCSYRLLFTLKAQQSVEQPACADHGAEGGSAQCLVSYFSTGRVSKGQ